MGGIPYNEQYYVEKERNTKYQALTFAAPAALMIIHGLIFHWIPLALRNKRDQSTLNHKIFFRMLNVLQQANTCIAIPTPWRKNIKYFYFQPSLVLCFCVYFMFLAIFSFVETKDINYEPRTYIVGKRLGRLAIGAFPNIFLFVHKNHFISVVSGLQPERLVRFHIWIGRLMWLSATIHLYLCASYWLDMGITLMIFIPPQYFGMIAYACCCFLCWASLRFIRRASFEVFLIQHRVFSGIMLLFTLFHNTGSRGAVIISVHLLVLDRVVSRVIGRIQAAKSPSKMISKFEAFDEDTVLVTIPVKANRSVGNDVWWRRLLPEYGSWKPGQFVQLTIPAISKAQLHPFTISSLPESGEMKLLIRKKKGFTKKLLKKVLEISEDKEIVLTTYQKFKLSIDSKIGYGITFLKEKLYQLIPRLKPNSVDYDFGEKDPVTMKVGIGGPYGGNIQRLFTFDSVLFISAGSGASVTFPACLHLLREIERRELNLDFLYRPESYIIEFVWSIRHERNIIWYKHIIDELIPYLEKKKFKLTIHITSADVNFDFDSASFLSSNENEKQISKISDGGSDTFSSPFVVDSSNKAIKYAKKIIISGLIDIQYGRMAIQPSISNATQQIIQHADSPSSKSLAVVACGPEGITEMTKYECQRNRRVRNSPDIYCFTESY